MGADLEARLRELPARLESVHAAAATAVLAGMTVLVGGVRDREPAPTVTPAAPRGPAPTDRQLTPWPTRGPLAGDPAERAAVLRDLDAAARGDRTPFLRSPTAAPTHVLWLGPAYPDPLP